MRKHWWVLLVIIGLLALSLISCAPVQYTLNPDVTRENEAVYHLESCYVDISIEAPMRQREASVIQLQNNSTIANADVEIYRARDKDKTSRLFHAIVFSEQTAIKDWRPVFNEWLLVSVELLGGYAPCESLVKLTE